MLKALHIGLIIIIITIIHEQSCRFKTLSVRASSNAFISSLALNADFIPKSSLNLYVFFYIFDNLLYVLCEKKNLSPTNERFANTHNYFRCTYTIIAAREMQFSFLLSLNKFFLKAENFIYI